MAWDELPVVGLIIRIKEGNYLPTLGNLCTI